MTLPGKGVFTRLLDSGEKRNLSNISISWPVLLHKKAKPKKNIREGFLNKQGGFNANKGWRKRWVVFDGSKLSYYSSNKSQVSNRVVPVSCIKNVEIDPKSDGLKFKVFSTLKDRVFVFQAEKRDDCTMWANILMAEVVAHKKKSKAETGAVVPPKPDKEGFIHFSNMKEYYVTITGQTLRYFQSFDDFQEGSPVHEIDMKLASVKDNESKKQRLQLWVHYGHFELSFPSEHEKQQWRLAMEDAIAEGLSDDTVLKKVYENLSNQKCADCGADNPHWASINLGIVVCKNCAGVHRMFDFRISKIKSLRMDTRVWTPSLVELIVTVGNANANLFWASKLTSGEAIHSKDTIEKRKHFIMNKYVHKKYADKHPLLNLKPALGEELLKAAKDDNVLETMRILFSGADVMYRQNGDGPTAYELVKQSGQRLVLEFLFQNGGDRCAFLRGRLIKGFLFVSAQSLVDNVQDENRLREDVRLQGFLNKTGPLGKSFERRWCVIEHGALSYYVNEKNNMIRGSIDRKDMVMISAVENDRMGYQFELSTTIRDNRTYIFSSDIKDDTGEWMRTIAKISLHCMEQTANMRRRHLVLVNNCFLYYQRDSTLYQ
ncbi:ARF-GAP with RHO-GAP domain, ank repeat and ph domain-containing [Plakobranchus ocellatus]|uniref:ARF-GAP with RHO-GAP domain, ank repeat and ph domain-containing n=1 Tax=Plakobranchus ocellatus TaxID=259542 RepID=A0AAV3Y4F9_9GAST|nr:ARF-GAP with RHO-GAP domain, ank repeat and ph domain-containing [Plakobranchus ocellatus]